ncbi:MAG TPA: glycoside hydrolase family 3 N-terminal domain-containing protein, partial [Rhodanobacteraceae bacterium]|nr:glycoside hydrolase family 3 N-terminal domain-containing protein [Rhodanobacteraceae bacterium]
MTAPGRTTSFSSSPRLLVGAAPNRHCINPTSDTGTNRHRPRRHPAMIAPRESTTAASRRFAFDRHPGAGPGSGVFASQGRDDGTDLFRIDALRPANVAPVIKQTKNALRFPDATTSGLRDRMKMKAPSFVKTAATALALPACLAFAASVAATPTGHDAASVAQSNAKHDMKIPGHDDNARPWMNSRLSPDQRAALVLKAMTQDERFRLLRTESGDSHPRPPGALGSAGYQPAITRLGLPAIQESDAGLGVAKPLEVGATALPSGLATAASFDPTLAYEGGAMIGSEAHRRGFNVMLAGGADLVRDPRNGRNFEYAGEDPLLGGLMVGNAVAGIRSQHVVSTIKHFALNDLETARNTLSANIDRAAARESDLLAFEIAIETGHPGSVMCSYNRINFVYA